MKIVVVDTNVLFVALRAKGANVRAILSSDEIDFYAPNFIIAEIFKHKDKLVLSSSATEEDVNEFLAKSLQHLHFVNEEFIGTGNFIQAYRLCNDVDSKDTPFVALALELGAELWTRDQKLIHGLTKKGFVAFFDENIF